MDEEYAPDRRSEAINSVTAMFIASGKVPTPLALQKLLDVVYRFAVQDDVYFSDGGDNIIKLTKGEK